MNEHNLTVHWTEKHTHRDCALYTGEPSVALGLVAVELKYTAGPRYEDIRSGGTILTFTEQNLPPDVIVSQFI